MAILKDLLAKIRSSVSVEDMVDHNFLVVDEISNLLYLIGLVSCNSSIEFAIFNLTTSLS